MNPGTAGTRKVNRTMPFVNKTGMSEEERELLGRWVDEGARAE